jgi:hypothetical protein
MFQKYILVWTANPSITRTHINTYNISIQKQDIQGISAQTNWMAGTAEKRSQCFVVQFMNVNCHNVTSFQENGLFVLLKNPAALRMKLEVVDPDNPVIVTNGLEKTTTTERHQEIPALFPNGSPWLCS